MEEDESDMDFLVEMLEASGFKVVPIQAIIDLLAEMEEQVRDATGLTQEELDPVLDKIQELVGYEESLTMSLDEIIGWVRAIQGN